MSRHRQTQGSLIDVSPPSSDYSTPHSFGPSSNNNNNNNPSSAPAASYGFGSTVMGLWRRLSSMDEQQQHFVQRQPGLESADSSSASQQQQPSLVSSMFSAVSGGDGIHGAFTPPRRQASPVGLPSLSPLSLAGFRPDTEPEQQLLNTGIAEEIRTFLPERLKIVDSWSLVYSLYQNGSSLGTLYKLCDEYRGRRVGFVLVVRDGTDSVRGGSCPDLPGVHATYGPSDDWLLTSPHLAYCRHLAPI